MVRLFLLSVAALASLALAGRADDALAVGLQEKAPAVIEHLKKKGFSNTGVLKFLVRRGESGPGRDDVGDLNLSLANKMEVALILANTDEKFGIIDKASEFVTQEKMTSANHLTADGRKAFFTRKYDLAWSKDKVEPSGFVTGIVSISDDLKKLTVKLMVFDKSGAIEELPGVIVVPVEPETLGQAGMSFAVTAERQKALVSGGPPPSAETRRSEAVAGAIKAAAQKPKVPEPKVEPKPEPKPEPKIVELPPFAPLVDCPVKWTVRYADKPVKVTGNVIPEPAATEKVDFVLSNPGPGTYAVVLLVNGESTLYQEKAAPFTCRKWVLTPGMEITIRGFQVDQDTVAPFRVLKPEEHGPDTVSYGPHAGTFRLVVYHGTMTDKTSTDEPPADKEQAGMLAISNTRGGTRPDGVKPQSLRALQADLRGRAKTSDGARGYVVKSATAEKFETNTVQFAASSDTPVADISLRYFVPKN